MRAMVLDYQDDPKTQQLATQFMLGDSLLVASATTSLASGSEGVSAIANERHRARRLCICRGQVV